jgi:cell shape-determining protein MreC
MLTVSRFKKYLGLTAVIAGYVFFVFAGNKIVSAKIFLADLRDGFVKEQPQEQLLRLLRQKNQELEAEILNLKIAGEGGSQGQKEAKVYSRYPFSNRSEIIINAGDSDDLVAGMPVTLGKKILVGKIKRVYGKTAVVQTVFDLDFQIPVRVGAGEIDALFSGGLSPKLTLIDGKVFAGDAVVSSSDGFPYGLVVGKVGEDNPGGEVLVVPNFELKNLRNVFVLLD